MKDIDPKEVVFKISLSHELAHGSIPQNNLLRLSLVRSLQTTCLLKSGERDLAAGQSKLSVKEREKNTNFIVTCTTIAGVFVARKYEAFAAHP